MINSKEVFRYSLSGTLLYISGLLLPCMTVYPRAGEYTGLLKIFSPSEFEPKVYTVLSAIGEVYESGHLWITLILFLFTIVFPVLKMGVLLLYGLKVIPDKGKLLSFINILGKFSMMDVFVLSLLVLSIKSLPGGSSVELNSGIYFLAGSILISVYSGYILNAPCRNKKGPAC
ncbi:MAG: paraquat-inducible protein A [Lentisphaeraceae bacterium]|nr:paraquat-inducible protein A [Lentisphaeraceae bacterium]